MGIDKKKLSKLKQEADKAFNAKQEAYEIRKEAFDKLETLVKKHNSELWKNYKEKCATIESLRKNADMEHREMIKSFEEAHQKYEEGERARAKELSLEGYAHQAERNELNQLVQRLCREDSAKKEYIEKHELPRKISNLLKMDLESIQELFSQADELSEFILTLKDARFKDKEFCRLKTEYKEKQDIYQIYKQFGDDPALNDMLKSSGNWEATIKGWIDEHQVTLRIGKEGTTKEGDTLIADGHLSRAQFDKKHNHYGNNRYTNIKEKRIEDAGGDRGAYTGPGR